MGIGNTAAASLLTHCLTDADLATVIGRGTGLDDAGLDHKRGLLAKAVARGRPPTRSPLLAEYGGFEIAMMAGAMLGAAEAKMVLLIDGFIVTSALLVAHAIAPDPRLLRVRPPLPTGRPRGASGPPGRRTAGAADLRLGEGTGAALVYPLVQAAVNFLNGWPASRSAGVAGKA